MRLIRSLAIAFSMYSKIPVPNVKWEEVDMKYVMAFFPFVGVIIGAAEYLVFILAEMLGLDHLFTAAIVVCIPLVLTGGIHMDGFMDMSDAVSSYRSREERLMILKDPHIGAFAVIKGIVIVLLYFGAACDIVSSGREDIFGVLCVSFMVSRIGSALAAVCCRSAKNEGTLYSFVKASDKGIVLAMLSVEAVAAVISAARISFAVGLIVLPVMAVSYPVCIFLAYRRLGGLTGDAAGWMLCIAECSAVFSAAMAGHLLHL